MAFVELLSCASIDMVWSVSLPGEKWQCVDTSRARIQSQSLNLC